MTEIVKPQLGRNEPCHCGSGKKYKQCCLAQDEAKAREARAAAAPTATEPPPPAESAESAEVPRDRPTRQTATPHPWKRSQAPRGVPRFTAPRRSGGS